MNQHKEDNSAAAYALGRSAEESGRTRTAGTESSHRSDARASLFVIATVLVSWIRPYPDVNGASGDSNRKGLRQRP